MIFHLRKLSFVIDEYLSEKFGTKSEKLSEKCGTKSQPQYSYKLYTLFFYKKPVYKKLGAKIYVKIQKLFCSIVNLNNREQKNI